MPQIPAKIVILPHIFKISRIKHPKCRIKPLIQKQDEKMVNKLEKKVNYFFLIAGKSR